VCAVRPCSGCCANRHVLAARSICHCDIRGKIDSVADFSGVSAALKNVTPVTVFILCPDIHVLRIPSLHCSFLKADFRILVRPSGGPWNATYLRYFVPGVIFMVVFAFVVPAAYFFILYFLRHRLQVGAAAIASVLASSVGDAAVWRLSPHDGSIPLSVCASCVCQCVCHGGHGFPQEPKVQARFGFLYKGYDMPYWETFEMVRKLLIGAIPVFVPAQPFGSTQVTTEVTKHLARILYTKRLNQAAGCCCCCCCCRQLWGWSAPHQISCQLLTAMRRLLRAAASLRCNG